jgi:perosamine synthetase
MIPRLKPYLGISELAAALRMPHADDVEQFEASFAARMAQKYALAFPYGRVGLMLLLEALGLKDREIICPAYTCVVVAHAITFSGNRPVFIDCQQGGFNMDLDQAERAITQKTGAIIATSLFGYPVDLDRLDEIRRRHPGVAIIQDCAHSYSASWKGRPVQTEGIAALFGLNISKTITSVFGGMITTSDERLYTALRGLRSARLEAPGLIKSLDRLAYLLAVYPAFCGPVYAMINTMERSGLIDNFVRYYDPATIDMPADHLKHMTGIEARVGKANLGRYDQIIDKRREAASCYFEHLAGKKDFGLPPAVEGSTYSHFVVQVPERRAVLCRALRRGVQLGELIEYSIPEMKSYGGAPPDAFPRAAGFARHSINLPVWGGERTAMEVLRRLR